MAPRACHLEVQARSATSQLEVISAGADATNPLLAHLIQHDPLSTTTASSFPDPEAPRYDELRTPKFQIDSDI